jgi:hypothetical protein
LITTDLLLGNHNDQPHIFAPVLYAFQKDVLGTSADPMQSGWEKLLFSDPFVSIKTTGRFNSQPFGPDEELFSFAFISLSVLINSINDFLNKTMSEIILRESDLNPFPELVTMAYDRLPAEKKVVVQALSSSHNAGIVMPMVFLFGIIKPMEYAKGLVALKIKEVHEMGGILLDLANAINYLECLEQSADTGLPASVIIREGENDVIEFKSTLRWDIRAGKTNPAVERASLKTIAAFLNSSGCTLLIGVRDDGSIEGIESDKFVNDDKFLLHLWTLIRNCFGREVSPYVRTTLEKMDGKTVCRVFCRQSNSPVFLRQPGYDEAFYIRVGPSSNAMDISEALKYIADHYRGS